MNLSEWFVVNTSNDDRKKLAGQAGTSIGYLEQIVYGNRKASPVLCRKLFESSKNITPNQVIKPSSERPDIDEIFQLGKEAPAKEEVNQ